MQQFACLIRSEVKDTFDKYSDTDTDTFCQKYILFAVK